MGQPRQRSVLAAVERLYRAGTGAGLSDAELMERYATRHGEAAEAAFAALVERHGPMVLRVCRRVLIDPHDAQDAFQATFLILVRQPGAVRQRASLAGWLHGVALRVSAHSRAASARRRVVEQAAGSRLPSGYLPNDDRHEVWDEVDRLPERYRLAVIHCYLEGLTHEQAAERLGWPVGTVRSRLARARERLRGRLVKRGLAPSSVVLAGLVSCANANPVPLALVEHTIKAAMLVAAHDAAEAGLVSASAAALTEGVLRTMFFAKLKTAALALVTAGAVAAGAGVYGYQAPQPASQPTAAVVEVVADDSATPGAAPVVSDGSEPRGKRVAPGTENPRRGPMRDINREVERDRAERLTSIPEKIAALTAAAREEQNRGNLTAAAGMVGAITDLAKAWNSTLIQLESEAPPARPDEVSNRPAARPSTRTDAYEESALARELTGISPARPVTVIVQPVPPTVPSLPPLVSTRPRTTPPPVRIDETDRRLAAVEEKLERVLRALDGDTETRPARGSSAEPRAAQSIFKKKKAPVFVYPKREAEPAVPAVRAEPAVPAEPAAASRPPVPPRPPQPPEPPRAPDENN